MSDIDASAANAERSQQIVEVAARLFDEAGYNQSSMADLAAAVGLAKPTLYHYFKSKDEILFRIHQDFISQLVAGQEARAASDLPPSDQLKGMIHDILMFIHTHRAHVRIFYEHQRELRPDKENIVREQRRRYREMLETVIANGVTDGTFRTTDVSSAAIGILGMCNWMYRYRSEPTKSPEELADFYFDLIVKGL
jgi:AcrR family transcriptional regulator